MTSPKFADNPAHELDDPYLYWSYCLGRMSTRVLNMHRLVYLCAGGLMVANSLPHLLPVYSRASCELPGVPVPDELVNHVRKIANGMGLANSHRIQVFIASGHSSVSGGTTLLPTGALIGLPRTVLFRGKEEVKQSNMMLGGEPVKWDSPEGTALLKLFPFSAGLINFRIAHEVAHVKRLDFLWNVILSPVLLVTGYHLTVFLCQTVAPFTANLSLAFPLLFSVTIFAYAEISALINQWQEFRADRTAALCSMMYAQGGVELMRTGLQLEALARASHKGKLSSALQKFLDIFSDHPAYDKRLQRLENILKLHSHQDNNDIHS